jgi:hypothetical protein
MKGIVDNGFFTWGSFQRCGMTPWIASRYHDTDIAHTQTVLINSHVHFVGVSIVPPDNWEGGMETFWLSFESKADDIKLDFSFSNSGIAISKELLSQDIDESAKPSFCKLGKIYRYAGGVVIGSLVPMRLPDSFIGSEVLLTIRVSINNRSKVIRHSSFSVDLEELNLRSVLETSRFKASPNPYKEVKTNVHLFNPIKVSSSSREQSQQTSFISVSVTNGHRSMELCVIDVTLQLKSTVSYTFGNETRNRALSLSYTGGNGLKEDPSEDSFESDDMEPESPIDAFHLLPLVFKQELPINISPGETFTFLFLVSAKSKDSCSLGTFSTPATVQSHFQCSNSKCKAHLPPDKMESNALKQIWAQIFDNGGHHSICIDKNVHAIKWSCGTACMRESVFGKASVAESARNVSCTSNTKITAPSTAPGKPAVASVVGECDSPTAKAPAPQLLPHIVNKCIVASAQDMSDVAPFAVCMKAPAVLLAGEQTEIEMLIENLTTRSLRGLNLYVDSSIDCGFIVSKPKQPIR